MNIERDNLYIMMNRTLSKITEEVTKSQLNKYFKNLKKARDK